MMDLELPDRHEFYKVIIGSCKIKSKILVQLEYVWYHDRLQGYGCELSQYSQICTCLSFKNVWLYWLYYLYCIHTLCYILQISKLTAKRCLLICCAISGFSSICFGYVWYDCSVNSVGYQVAWQMFNSEV